MAVFALGVATVALLLVAVALGDLGRITRELEKDREALRLLIECQDDTDRQLAKCLTVDFDRLENRTPTAPKLDFDGGESPW